MSNRKKLNELLKTRSSWEDEARFREENEEWLSFSFEVAVRVLDTLREKKMTQKDLAERMSVSPQFINKIVRGQEENLSIKTIAKISQALGITLRELMGVDKSREIAPPAHVAFDLEQAYAISERYRQHVFEQASSQGYVGLRDVKKYMKEGMLEFKLMA